MRLFHFTWLTNVWAIIVIAAPSSAVPDSEITTNIQQNPRNGAISKSSIATPKLLRRNVLRRRASNKLDQSEERARRLRQQNAQSKTKVGQPLTSPPGHIQGKPNIPPGTSIQPKQSIKETSARNPKPKLETSMQMQGNGNMPSMAGKPRTSANSRIPTTQKIAARGSKSGPATKLTALSRTMPTSGSSTLKPQTKAQPQSAGARSPKNALSKGLPGGRKKLCRRGDEDDMCVRENGFIGGRSPRGGWSLNQERAPSLKAGALPFSDEQLKFLYGSSASPYVMPPDQMMDRRQKERSMEVKKANNLSSANKLTTSILGFGLASSVTSTSATFAGACCTGTVHCGAHVIPCASVATSSLGGAGICLGCVGVGLTVRKAIMDHRNSRAMETKLEQAYGLSKENKSGNDQITRTMGETDRRNQDAFKRTQSRLSDERQRRDKLTEELNGAKAALGQTREDITNVQKEAFGRIDSASNDLRIGQKSTDSIIEKATTALNRADSVQNFAIERTNLVDRKAGEALDRTKKIEMNTINKVNSVDKKAATALNRIDSVGNKANTALGRVESVDNKASKALGRVDSVDNKASTALGKVGSLERGLATAQNQAVEAKMGQIKTEKSVEDLRQKALSAERKATEASASMENLQTTQADRLTQLEAQMKALHDRQAAEQFRGFLYGSDYMG